jgi:hypothetical protein
LSFAVVPKSGFGQGKKPSSFKGSSRSSRKPALQARLIQRTLRVDLSQTSNTAALQVSSSRAGLSDFSP